MIDLTPLFTAKEIAAIWRRRVDWVYALKRDGLEMPGGRVTREAVVAHLRIHPYPRRRSAARRKY